MNKRPSVGGGHDSNTDERALHDFFGQNFWNVFKVVFRGLVARAAASMFDVGEAVAQMKRDLPIGKGLQLNFIVTVGRKPELSRSGA